MKLLALATVDRYRLLVFLTVVVVNVAGIFGIFSEARRQARIVQYDLMTNQVEATSRSVDILFSTIIGRFQLQARDLETATHDGTLPNARSELLRYQDTVVARVYRTPDGAVHPFGEESALSPTAIQTIASSVPWERIDAVSTHFPVVTPETQCAVIAMPTRTGSFLGIVIDLQRVFEAMLTDINVGDLGSIWVTDGDGRVLHDVEPEIIGRYLPELHADYPTLLQVDQRILSERSGTAAYRFLHRATGEEIGKLVAWRHVDLPGASIVVALSTSEDEVTGGLQTLLFRVIIVAVLSIGILFVYAVFAFRRDRRRRLEEEQRLQDLVDERSQELSYRRRHYQTLFETANDAVFVADYTTGVIVDANTAATSLLQKGRDEIIGKPITTLHPPEELDAARGDFNKTDPATGRRLASGFHVLTATGERVPVEISTSIVEIDNRVYAYGIFRDVTERERIERELRSIAEEREALLREVLHRTKNNLTLVASVLSMQAGSADDEAVEAALKKAVDRVMAMADIQEMLSHSERAESVHLDRYLREIVERLVDAYASEGCAVGTEISAAPVVVPVKTGINIGLVVNEIVTNSMKYAFVGRSTGHIHLTLRVGDDEMHLIVTDDGVGFDDAATESAQRRSLGLTLIEAITAQLDATVERDSAPNAGTRWELHIPLPAPVVPPSGTAGEHHPPDDATTPAP